MIPTEINLCRMLNQKLLDSDFKKPERVVKWFVAMQAQELPMVKWAIALRVPGITEVDVDNAFNSGKILRTHIMRPTWHFVLPDDIRWMIELTAPRIHAINASSYRKFELDTKVLIRTSDIIAKTLEGGNHLERAELQKALAGKKIKVEGIRLAYVMMRAELDAIICSGPRRGNQFTYALLSERAPKARRLSRDEALAELVLRFFTSRAPATVQDFVYWSGLTIKDAKRGVEINDGKLVQKSTNNHHFIFGKNSIKRVGSDKKSPSAFLLPDYDEYGMSYKDRTAMSVQIPSGKTLKPVNGVKTFNHLLLADGAVIGLWQRQVKENLILLRTGTISKLTAAQRKLIDHSVKEYGRFFNRNLKHGVMGVGL